METSTIRAPPGLALRVRQAAAVRHRRVPRLVRVRRAQGFRAAPRGARVARQGGDAIGTAAITTSIIATVISVFSDHGLDIYHRIRSDSISIDSRIYFCICCIMIISVTTVGTEMARMMTSAMMPACPRLLMLVEPHLGHFTSVSGGAASKAVQHTMHRNRYGPVMDVYLGYSSSSHCPHKTAGLSVSFAF